MPSELPNNKNTLLLVVIITSYINPFMGAAINIALPDIAQSLNLNTIGMSWVGMTFLLSSAVFLVPMGKIADIKGRKRVFLWGNIIVTLGSLLCAMAWNQTSLLTGRVVQGIGASMMFGTGMAMITSAFEPHERGKAIGFAVSSTYLGLTTAPVVGGLMTELWGWRSLFFITVPVGIIVILITAIVLRQEWADARNDSFDWKGSIVYVVFMSVMMLGFTKLPDTNATIATIIGLTGIIIFVKLQLRTQFPVINIQLFRSNRIFAFSNLAALINYAATFAISFLLSLYLQYIKGMSPSEAGLFMITQPIFMTLFASVSGRLSDKYNPGVLASVGMSLIVIGLAMLAPIDAQTHNCYLIAALIVLGIGFGIFSSPNTNAIMGSVERNDLGIASATVSTMRLTGQMLSMGIATLILHIYLGGNGQISSQIPQFINSMHTSFVLFALLCLIGVFASMARHQKNR